MANDIFISYTTSDAKQARQVKATLENNGYHCWMAPESIPGGSSYANEIDRAIKECKVMVIILSDRAQDSVWIPKEVSRAINYNKSVIPLHIDESVLRNPFSFFLADNQLIEAYKNLVDAYEELLSVVKRIVGECCTAEKEIYKQNELESFRRDKQRKGFAFFDKTVALVQCLLALIYDANQDYEQAFKWYQKSAEHGNVNAQTNLAVLYYDGNGTVQDYKQAFAWWKKAAELGSVNAQNNLANLYYDGNGTAQDYNQAFVWWRKAAEQGEATAQNNIGLMYEKGQGTNQDYGEALKWLQKSAKNGSALGQYNLANTYNEMQDYGQALKWYQKAAEQGDVDAQCNLGIMYYKGKGIAQNYNQAFVWWKKAAEQGKAKAQYNIGLMFKTGQGIPKDLGQAKVWLQQAADQGYVDAQNELDRLRK